MCQVAICFVLIVAAALANATSNVTEATSGSVPQEVLAQHEQKISEKILMILEHYKQEDPVGIPGAPVPDPMEIPPMSHSFAMGKMNFKNVLLSGLKNFRLDRVKVDIAAMKVQTALRINTLNVVGNYTLSTFFSRANGPFTIKLTDVLAKANGTLEVKGDGQLEAQDMEMDITFKAIEMDFKNLGFFANMFQSMMNNVGTFVFNSVKPFVLKEANTKLRQDVNKEVSKIPQRFPNSISPFDQLLVGLRHEIRKKYDPFLVPNYNTSARIFDIYMTHTWLTGLSSIHRVGDIILEIRNNTVHVKVQVGTQRMEGTTHWEVSLIAGMMSRAGTASFSVEYLTVELSLSQTMDTRNSPQLDDIQLELGNIQMRFEGAGTMDYAVEFAVNVLPNLLRYQIMDALESPVKLRIQDELSRIDVEAFIKKNADKFDNPNPDKALEELEAQFEEGLF